MINYLSIDLESWASPNLPEYTRLSSERRKAVDNGHIKESAIQILKILKRHKTKLTFFIVGQLYDWYPEVVDMISSQGHEIAYHTHDHDHLYSKEILINSLKKSAKFLKKFKPLGFRAPTILMKNECLGVLKNYGFKYDSSMYGPYELKHKADGLMRFPITSLFGIPIGSGYFIGMLGNKISLLYEKINKKNAPIISFIHNWQIIKPCDPTFPTRKYLFTHPHYLPYTRSCLSTFEYLIRNFKFAPMKNLVE